MAPQLYLWRRRLRWRRRPRFTPALFTPQFIAEAPELFTPLFTAEAPELFTPVFTAAAPELFTPAFTLKYLRGPGEERAQLQQRLSLANPSTRIFLATRRLAKCPPLYLLAKCPPLYLRAPPCENLILPNRIQSKTNRTNTNKG